MHAGGFSPHFGRQTQAWIPCGCISDREYLLGGNGLGFGVVGLRGGRSSKLFVGSLETKLSSLSLPNFSFPPPLRNCETSLAPASRFIFLSSCFLNFDLACRAFLLPSQMASGCRAVVLHRESDHEIWGHVISRGVVTVFASSRRWVYLNCLRCFSSLFGCL